MNIQIKEFEKKIIRKKATISKSVSFDTFAQFLGLYTCYHLYYACSFLFLLLNNNFILKIPYYYSCSYNWAQSEPLC